MKKYVSPEIEVAKVETADIMAASSIVELEQNDVDINVGSLMDYNPFA